MLFASNGGVQYSDLGSLGFLLQAGVLGIFTVLWLTKKIGVTDTEERDYLREQLARAQEEVLRKERHIGDLQESLRKEVMPALTDVARILPIIVDRLTK